MAKHPELTAQLHLEYKDNPAAYEQLMKLVSLAIEIADMDEDQAAKFQEIYLKDL